jgi:hypothetical protein
MFTTADVGICEAIGVSNNVLVAAAELPTELPAAELPALVKGTNSGVVLVTGTTGGTRLLLSEL